MVLHRTASSEPEPSLGEIMARLLSVERDNAEIKKENTEQKYKIAELETELSTMRQALMSSFVIVLFLSYSSLLLSAIHRIELRSTKSANASCSTWPATN
jgi:hypothetical protein